MPRVRYTVLSVSRGADELACHHHGARCSWSVTLADKDGKRHLLRLVQPSDHPLPHTTGQVISLDPRLLSAEEKG